MFAGKHKVDGNEFQPLTSEIRADLQNEVDAYYSMMVGSIASHRPKLTDAAIRRTEAGTYLGAAAVAAGLADEVGSMETTMVQLAKLHATTAESFTKYDRTALVYGKIDAAHERAKDIYAAGHRSGMAAALAGRSAT